jgi:hypothetical protein
MASLSNVPVTPTVSVPHTDFGLYPPVVLHVAAPTYPSGTTQAPHSCMLQPIATYLPLTVPPPWQLRITDGNPQPYTAANCGASISMLTMVPVPLHHAGVTEVPHSPPHRHVSAYNRASCQPRTTCTLALTYRHLC